MMFDDYEFALCLTHDVDRPYKTFQAPYYAIKERDPSHLGSLLFNERPYWQFEEIMDLETDLGVRSSFYFLNEQRLFLDKGFRDWLRPKHWKLFAGRYDIMDGEIVDMIQTLDHGGWEVGLHGSYESYADPDMIRREKSQLESILGHEVTGVRQHYLNLCRPETWTYHTDIGLQYDTSLGSSNTYGFQYGYRPLRPFGDDFVVFPLTIMECAILSEQTDLEAAWNKCYELLEEARENSAVMTVLWHPRFFNPEEFPGYRELYTRLVSTANKMNAWIGPCGDCYEQLSGGVSG